MPAQALKQAVGDARKECEQTERWPASDAPGTEARQWLPLALPRNRFAVSGVGAGGGREGGARPTAIAEAHA